MADSGRRTKAAPSTLAYLLACNHLPAAITLCWRAGAMLAAARRCGIPANCHGMAANSLRCCLLLTAAFLLPYACLPSKQEEAMATCPPIHAPSSMNWKCWRVAARHGQVDYLLIAATAFYWFFACIS